MTNARFARQSNKILPETPTRRFTFPKANRLLRRAEYRKVYDEGVKVAMGCFAAFCWRSPETTGPRIGFTAPRALGKAVLRNRMKRRVREALRTRLPQLDPHFWIVINLRRSALTAPFEKIEAEVGGLIERCNG